MRPNFTLKAPSVSGCVSGPWPNCTSVESCISKGSCLVQQTFNMMNPQVAGNLQLLQRFVKKVINLTKRNMNRNIRTGIMRESAYVCHEVFNTSLNKCFATFINGCLSLPSNSPSPCINLLYSQCRNRTKDCREAVENAIEVIIEKKCDEDYDDCVSLCTDLIRQYTIAYQEGGKLLLFLFFHCRKS